MVLGLRSKSRRSPAAAAARVEYAVHLHEIRPWPPSPSLRGLSSVALQWDNGGRSSGATAAVAPSADGGCWIEFDESFNLQVAFLKEPSSNAGGGFQKNLLEFRLYEARKGKPIKGGHLGGVTIDLAEHGVIREAVSVAVPMSFRRSLRCTAQPVLYLKIQPLAPNDDSSLSSKDWRDSESAATAEDLANAEEEVEVEEEIMSFTDDDESMHSSATNSSSRFEDNSDIRTPRNLHDERISRVIDNQAEGGEVESLLLDSSSESRSVSIEPLCPDGERPNESSEKSPSRDVPHVSSSLVKPVIESDRSRSSPTISGPSDTLPSSRRDGIPFDVSREKAVYRSHEVFMGAEEAAPSKDGTNGAATTLDPVVDMGSDFLLKQSSIGPSDVAGEDIGKNEERSTSLDAYDGVSKEPLARLARNPAVDSSIRKKQGDGLSEGMKEGIQSGLAETKLCSSFPDDPTIEPMSDDVAPAIRLVRPRSARQKVVIPDVLTPSRKDLIKSSSAIASHRLKNMKSSATEDAKDTNVRENLRGSKASSTADNGRSSYQSANGNSDKTRQVFFGLGKHDSSDDRAQQLELRVEVLEAELREAAAIEIALFSVVAEHGSSALKVHTPARRLSRLYIHASREWPSERRANAAKSAMSGLVLAAKSCGNDVSRLTFWLSNAIILRAVISREFGVDKRVPFSPGPYSTSNGAKSSPHRTVASSPARDFEDWEDPHTFVAALERTEAWIFSRIIESIWWQTLTPHMQSAANGKSYAENGSDPNRNSSRSPGLGNQQQANLSIEIWKRAFKESCDRLCPIRAAGHECGCLPMLARLVMEQCVARLDVAMFNAILRESDDEMPTDPTSDPISDTRVLPIPPRRLCFGSGAQLKNVVGNWSRWLTDLFGMDMDDSPRGEGDGPGGKGFEDPAEPFKPFRLLNALSDLLMLPKDMLVERSARKEVCPAFGAPLVERILRSFVPDVFYPEAVPDAVFESLGSEDPLETGEEEEGVSQFPCSAAPIIYSPPPVSLVEAVAAGRDSLSKSASSLVRKCPTSDDELEELESPLAFVVTDRMSPRAVAPGRRRGGGGASSAVRYQLLRDVWKGCD